MRMSVHIVECWMRSSDDVSLWLKASSELQYLTSAMKMIYISLVNFCPLLKHIWRHHQWFRARLPMSGGCRQSLCINLSVSFSLDVIFDWVQVLPVAANRLSVYSIQPGWCCDISIRAVRFTMKPSLWITGASENCNACLILVKINVS